LLYQKIEPFSSAIHANCAMLSAKVRNCSSLSRNAAAARFRAVMSRAIFETPTMRPKASFSAEAVTETSISRPSLVRRLVS